MLLKRFPATKLTAIANVLKGGQSERTQASTVTIRNWAPPTVLA